MAGLGLDVRFLESNVDEFAVAAPQSQILQRTPDGLDRDAARRTNLNPIGPLQKIAEFAALHLRGCQCWTAGFNFDKRLGCEFDFAGCSCRAKEPNFINALVQQCVDAAIAKSCGAGRVTRTGNHVDELDARA